MWIWHVQRDMLPAAWIVGAHLKRRTCLGCNVMHLLVTHACHESAKSEHEGLSLCKACQYSASIRTRMASTYLALVFWRRVMWTW